MKFTSIQGIIEKLCVIDRAKGPSEWFDIPSSVYESLVLPHEQATLTIKVTIPRKLVKSTIFPLMSSTVRLYSEFGGRKSIALGDFKSSGSFRSWWWCFFRSRFDVYFCMWDVYFCTWLTWIFAMTPNKAITPRKAKIAFVCDSLCRFIFEPLSLSWSIPSRSIFRGKDPSWAGFFRNISAVTKCDGIFHYIIDVFLLLWQQAVHQGSTSTVDDECWFCARMNDCPTIRTFIFWWNEGSLYDVVHARNFYGKRINSSSIPLSMLETK